MTEETKPLIIEFSGMPKSGKTTVIEILSQYFRRLGLSVKVHRDEGTYSNVGKSNIGPLNLQLAAQATSFIVESYYSRYSQPDVILVDRGIFDRCVFAEVLRSQGSTSSEEADATINFLLAESIRRAVRAVYAFVTSPRLSLAREHRLALTTMHGKVMNEEFLTCFRDQTLNLASNLSSKFDAIKVVDTEKMDGSERDTAKLVAMDILKKLPNAVLERISSNVNVLEQDDFVLVAAPTVFELPHIASKSGKFWYRYMDRIYVSKSKDTWNENDAVAVCDTRLDHLDDLTDFDLNTEICRLAAGAIDKGAIDGKKMKVLDFGCGSGLSIELISQEMTSPVDIVGADLSEKAVEFARRKSHSVLQISDNNIIPEESEFFDAAVAIYVMHLNIKVEALRELKRVTKRSAPFVFNLYESDVSSVAECLNEAGWSTPELLARSKRMIHHGLYITRSLD